MGDLGPKNESQQELASISERRKFLKKAGKAALTAPAVALLLSAESKQGHAITISSVGALTPDLKTKTT